MRLFRPTLGLLILALTAILALRLRDHLSWRAVDETLFETDPHARAEWAEKEGILGSALSGYEELVRLDPSDLDAQRSRFATLVRLNGATYAALQLAEAKALIEMLAESIKTYLEHREALDPDGSFLQGLLDEWAESRLANPGFHVQASAALYLAGQGDQRGLERLRYFAREGPFYTELLRYAIRYHPPFRAIEPMLAHYLDEGPLNARVLAGSTLLEYHTLFGEGAELLARYRPVIRECFYKSVREVDHKLAAGEDSLRVSESIFGLARLGGPEERRVLSAMRGVDYPRQLIEVRIARLWIGADPIEKYLPDSDYFDDLDGVQQIQYYHQVANRFVTLEEGETKEIYLDLLKSALISSAPVLRSYAIKVMARHAPDELDLKRIADGGGTDALTAANLLDGDRVPYLLPGITSPEPNLSALAAISLLERK